MVQSTSFADLWDFEGEDIAKKIKWFDWAAKGTTGATALWMVKAGMTPWGLGVGAAWSAGIYAFNRKKQKEAVARLKEIIGEESTLASDDIQKIAQKLYEKAGVTATNPVVVVADPSGEKPQDILYRCSAGVFLDTEELGLAAPGEDLIFIGHRLIEECSIEEISAILAHEVSHVLVTPPKLSTMFNKATGLAEAGNNVGNSVTGKWKASIPSMFLTAGKQQFLRMTKRLDETRADRNSIALYPHPTALPSALAKVYDLVMEELGVGEENTGLRAFFKGAQAVNSVHPLTETRQKNIATFYSEVDRFYRDNGIEMDFTEIAGNDNSYTSWCRPPKPPEA